MEVLDVVATAVFAFQTVASRLCFHEKARLKLRFWWMRAWSESVEAIPNCVVCCGASRRHEDVITFRRAVEIGFSWCFVRRTRPHSLSPLILVAMAGSGQPAEMFEWDLLDGAETVTLVTLLASADRAVTTGHDEGSGYTLEWTHFVLSVWGRAQWQLDQIPCRTGWYRWFDGAAQPPVFCHG